MYFGKTKETECLHGLDFQAVDATDACIIASMATQDMRHDCSNISFISIQIGRCTNKKIRMQNWRYEMDWLGGLEKRQSASENAKYFLTMQKNKR